MECKSITELLLWNNCNNNCKFCFQKHNQSKYPRKFLDEQGKINSLNKAKDFLKRKFSSGTHLLLVGGELFDSKFGQKLENCFYSFLHFVIDMMIRNEIDLLYVNTNLLYENLDYLNHFLGLVEENGLFDRLKFTTSYDVEGRFSENSHQLFHKNLKAIKDFYPNINIVVNMIMTKQFCDAILEKKLNILEFCEFFKVKVNTIPYIILKDNLAATREKIYSTLIFLERQNPGYLRDYILNVSLPQDKLLYEFDGDKYVFMTAKNSTCGHNENFKRYQIDKKRCFICDMIMLGEAVNV